MTRATRLGGSGARPRPAVARSLSTSPSPIRPALATTGCPPTSTRFGAVVRGRVRFAAGFRRLLRTGRGTDHVDNSPGRQGCRPSRCCRRGAACAARADRCAPVMADRPAARGAAPSRPWNRGFRRIPAATGAGRGSAPGIPRGLVRYPRGPAFLDALRGPGAHAVWQACPASRGRTGSRGRGRPAGGAASLCSSCPTARLRPHCTVVRRRRWIRRCWRSPPSWDGRAVPPVVCRCAAAKGSWWGTRSAMFAPFDRRAAGRLGHATTSRGARAPYLPSATCVAARARSGSALLVGGFRPDAESQVLVGRGGRQGRGLTGDAAHGAPRFTR